MTEHLCVCCPQLRSGEPRIWERANVCEGDRTLMATWLSELQDDAPELPHHLYRTTVHAERVSGSSEPVLPIAEDVWDLLQPATLSHGHGDWPQDQIGFISIATFVDLWCRDWADTRGQGEVGSGVDWLKVRLEWACDEHPAIDDFAHELARIHHAVHRYAGAREPRPELCRGVPCRRCDAINTLYRRVDGTGDVECHNPDCRLVYRAAEYHQWVGMNAAMVRRRSVTA